MDCCQLCDSPLSSEMILDEECSFCCVGCRAVFRILSARNQLSAYRDSDLFKQAIASGLISNPVLLEQLKESKAATNERQRVHLEIGDMWCPSCAEVIRWVLLKEKGVLNCVVDYATDLASIEFAPRLISKEKILSFVGDLGYRATSLQDASHRTVSLSLWLRFIVAAFFSLNIMMFSYPIYAAYFDADATGTNTLFVWMSFFCSLPVLFYSGWPILRRFWSALSVGIAGMEALIVLGVSSAFALSFYEMLHGGTQVYFDSMTVIITFVLLGKIIESKAKFSARESLLRLSRAIPRRGRKRFQDGKERFIPVKEILRNDLVVALSGEKIVLDGVVIEGEGACDEAIMTGEALPVRKEAGSILLGGTVLSQGNVVYRVTAAENETALHKILEMVRGDLLLKTPYIRPVDKIVAWFVPAVLVFALGTFLTLIWQGEGNDTAVLRAVSILLISCPCAIGIAAPLAESQLLNALASLGAIVRNRGCLQYLGLETVYIFDKTGTITEGRFKVQKGLEELTQELRGILKGLCIKSNHPISCAISLAVDAMPFSFTKIQEFPGRGMYGEFEGHAYRLGSLQWMKENGVKIAVPEMQGIETLVYFVQDRHCFACISLGDELREGVKDVLQDLKPLKRLLLSGDGKEVVEEVGRVCYFDEWQWECHPLDKKELIDQFKEKGEIVVMLGDGINDAPALTSAHIGISVVNATDITIQVSDILLTTDRLQVLPIILALAKKGRKILHQNLFWAFFYNIIGIALAAAGYLHPIFAAGAMTISSLIVLFNARRLH